jgi:hypothetical protein
MVWRVLTCTRDARTHTSAAGGAGGGAPGGAVAADAAARGALDTRAQLAAVTAVVNDGVVAVQGEPAPVAQAAGMVL